MKTIKYLTHPLTISIICLISILCSQKLVAQDWRFQVGINSAQFRFSNPINSTADSFQPEAGLHLSIAHSKPLVDSFKTKSAFVRKLLFQWGIHLNEFNSSGVVQNIPFSYSTTYAGLKSGLGMRSNLGKGFTLSYSGLLQVNQLVMGSQKMGAQTFNLQGNNQFDRLQFHLGAELQVLKKLNTQTDLFIFFSDSWQLNTIQKDGSQFAINPTSFGFGLHYSPFNSHE